MTRELRGVWLGRRRYEPVHALQERLLAARRDARSATRCCSSSTSRSSRSVAAPTPKICSRRRSRSTELGVELVRTGRGGDVTLHAPGQLVCYPILDLSPDRCDVRRYVNDLTETMRRLASELGIDAGMHEKHVGLWADRAAPNTFLGSARAAELVKIGAIGVRISRWVTMHGFALNLSPDLSLYRVIVPCGIREHGVSSLATLGGTPIGVQSAARRAFEILGDVLGSRLERFDDRESVQTLRQIEEQDLGGLGLRSGELDASAR